MHVNHALIFASAPWATGDEAMALPYDARARKVRVTATMPHRSKSKARPRLKTRGRRPTQGAGRGGI